MPPFLLLLLIGGGLAAAIAASAGRRYALSEDCQTSLLGGMSADEVQAWTQNEIVGPLRTARDGKGVIAFRSVDGELPYEVVAEVAVCQGNLQLPVLDGGLGVSEGEAKQLCRIDGRTAYMPAERDDPTEIALYLYQQIAHPRCAVLEFGLWGDDSSLVFPSDAAECLFLALVLGVKMELLAQTLDDRYTVTAEDMERAAAVCPQDVGITRGSGTLGTVGSGHGTVGGAQKASFGASIGAPPGLNFRQMAADANRGVLHPAHVLTGAIFR